MGTYPYDEYHRVWLVPTIADITSPTTLEIAAGIDITCDLTKDGLSIPASTESVSRERWHNPLIGQDPGRYTFDGVILTGRRRTQGDAEPLYDAAGDFRGHTYLVVRRGLLYEVPFIAGQDVEVYGCRYGMRFTLPSRANASTTFAVPLFVSSNDAAATVVGAEAILEENSDPILEETSDPILEE